MAARSIKLSRFTSSLHKIAHSPLISRSSTIIPRTHLNIHQVPSNRSLSTTKPTMIDTTPTNSDAFIAAIKNRRNYYALNKDVPMSDARIQGIVKEAILNVPSSFNSQSTRLVVLLGKEHDDFWDIVMEVLESLMPKDRVETTRQKIAGFKGAYGSVRTLSISHFPFSCPEYKVLTIIVL